MHKSPFLVINELISPMECENILNTIETTTPDELEDGTLLKTLLSAPVPQMRIWNALSGFFEQIEEYYSVNILELSAMDIEWFPEDCIQEQPRCDNSIYINKSWRITNDNDFTVIIFLKDYNDSTAFDDTFECYGGKLEIINHLFSFTPIRGTAIIFPSNQYFIHRTVSPQYGDAFQIRLHITCEERFKYDRMQYLGNYKTWFGA